MIDMTPSLQSIGIFNVFANENEIQNFFNALQAVSGTSSDHSNRSLPASYAVSWLTRPEIAAAIHTIPHFALGPCILIGQALSQKKAIQAETHYVMHLTWRSPNEKGDIFEIIGSVNDQDGQDIVSITSTLRLVKTWGAA